MGHARAYPARDGNPDRGFVVCARSPVRHPREDGSTVERGRGPERSHAGPATRSLPRLRNHASVEASGYWRGVVTNSLIASSLRSATRRVFVDLIHSPTVSCCVTVPVVIRSFRHKGLRQLFEAGTSAKASPDQQSRILRLLDVLESSATPGDMNLPGFYFHRLRGRPVRYSVRVTGNWRLTFGWKDSDAVDVGLEDYH